MSSLNRAERALQAARRTGTVHLGGEIEFPLTATLAEAHEHLFRIALKL